MKRIIRMIMVMMIVTLPVLSASSQSAAEIMELVASSQKHASSAMELHMNLIDSRGEVRQRTLQTLSSSENDVTKTITVFLSPASVKNTRFLTIENDSAADEQYIYLPSLAKVKRIAATERSGSFMGSDFSYADMASTTYDTSEATHSIIGTDTIEGIDCTIIESVLNISGDYGKTISWVDTERSVVVKVEFYAKDRSSLVKTLVCSRFELIDGKTVARSMVMTVADQSHSTAVEIMQIKLNIPIRNEYFTVSFLETGRL